MMADSINMDFIKKRLKSVKAATNPKDSFMLEVILETLVLIAEQNEKMIKQKKELIRVSREIRVNMHR